MDFSSKCDQIRRKLRIRSDLLENWLLENFIFLLVNEFHSKAYWGIWHFRENEEKLVKSIPIFSSAIHGTKNHQNLNKHFSLIFANTDNFRDLHSS